MANLLRVNGVPCPVLVGDASEQPDFIGEIERAEDGTKLINRRAIKMAYKIRVQHQAPTDGVAWRRLLSGEGETWNFDTSLYGSKGTGPSASTASAQSTANPKYGAGHLRQTGGASATISFPALAPGTTKWTVMLWRYYTALPYYHYVVTSSGHKWFSGARSDGVDTSWMTVTSATGVVKLDALGAPTVDVDDLVVLPFEVPDAWPPDIYAYGSAFSPLSKLYVDGDLIDANVGTKTVSPEVTGVEILPGYLGGTYYQSIRTVSATLEEG